MSKKHHDTKGCLFTEDEYNKIIASVSDKMNDDDVIKLVRYCEMTRIRQTRVGFILKGCFTVVGFGDDGSPIFKHVTK